MTDPDPNADPTPPRAPRPTGPIKYKGEELDAQRGPGLGCFRFQLVVLVAMIVLTPLSVVWRWPEVVSAAMLIVVILLLLTTGQTIIFLLRLVAADRRGRRRPLGSATRTVGELEDEAAAGATAEPGSALGAGPGTNRSTLGDERTAPGDLDAEPDGAETAPGDVDAEPDGAETAPGDVDAEADGAETAPGDVEEASTPNAPPREP